MTLSILPVRSPGHEVCVDGKRVPRVEVFEHPATGLWDLTLDGRFGLGEPVELVELQRWIWLLANAQAIGAGWSCFGENSVRSNPYNKSVFEITSASKE